MGWSVSHAPQDDLENEEWRVVEVDGVEVHVSNKCRMRFKNGRVTTPSRGSGDYVRVNVGGTKYTFHRLVAMAFVPNPDPERCTQVDHLDMDTENNHPENLEWVTQSENIRRSHRLNVNRSSGIKRKSRGVRVILVDGSSMEFESCREAARKLSLHLVNRSVNRSISSGKEYQGYRFEWLEQGGDLDGERWVEVTDDMLKFSG